MDRKSGSFIDEDSDNDTSIVNSDNDDPFSQSTPVSSALPSTTNNTPQPRSIKMKRRKKISKKSMLLDLPADFHQFVEVYEAQGKDSGTANSVDELKAEINDLKKGISSILSVLKAGT
jgi:hypothetical protein